MNFSRFDEYRKGVKCCTCAHVLRLYAIRCNILHFLLLDFERNLIKYSNTQIIQIKFRLHGWHGCCILHLYPAAVVADAGVTVRFSVGVKKHIVLLPGRRRHCGT